MIFKLLDVSDKCHFTKKGFLLGAVFPEQFVTQQFAQGILALLNPFTGALQLLLFEGTLLGGLLQFLRGICYGRIGLFEIGFFLCDLPLFSEQVAELFFNTGETTDQPFILRIVFEVQLSSFQCFLCCSPFSLFLPPGLLVCLNLCGFLGTGSSAF